MAALGLFLTLAVCVVLVNAQYTEMNNDAQNKKPCLPSSNNNAYNTFVSRHILKKSAPKSLDQKEWKKYISNNNLCDRPTQSFLKAKDKGSVDRVCSAKGGKMYKKNLCISQQKFTFVTVKSEKRTCKIKSVQEETKHLILACDLLDNRCLPVHFEANPKNRTPDKYKAPCQAPMKNGLPLSYNTSWLL